MQAEEELGFLPKNRQRFLNFTLVPSKPEPTAPADADTAPVKVAFADPDAYKKLAIAANAAASARVEAATATTATVALTGIQSRELPMSAFAAEQSAYSDGFVLSDQAVTDGTDSIKPVPSPASPAAPVSAPAPLAPTASTVSLHTHLDSAALLGADITVCARHIVFENTVFQI